MYPYIYEEFLYRLYSPRTEKKIVIAISLALFIYLVLRAYLVPITHDESATFFHYLHTGKFIPYYAQWDANNHLVNTLLSYGSFTIFGKSVFAIRIANVLSFLLYAFYARKITSVIGSQQGRIISFLALVTVQWVFEFFGLCRGYGLSMAFMLGVIWHLHQYFVLRTNRHLFFTMVFLSLAIWSNLALTCVMLLVFAMLLVFVLRRFMLNKTFPSRNTWLIVFCVGIIPCAMAVRYTLSLRTGGALYYGSLDGFIPVTITSLLKYQFGVYSTPVIASVIGIFFIAVITISWIWIKQKFSRFTFSHIMVVLLAGSWIGTWLLAGLLRVNYPEDRAAMYFVPLFILTVIFLVYELERIRKVYAILYLSLLLFPVQFVANLNLQVTRMWPDQSFPKEFHDRMVAEQQKSKELLTFSCYHLHEANWSFYNLNENFRLNPPQMSRTASQTADWQILFREVYKPVKDKYEVVLENDRFNQVLVKRKSPCKKTLFATKEYGAADMPEFFNLYEALGDSIPHGDLFFDIEIEMNSDAAPLQTHMVFAASSQQDPGLYYDCTRLEWEFTEWKNRKYRFTKCLHPLHPSANRFIVYVWNVNNVLVQVKSARIKVYTLSE